MFYPYMPINCAKIKQLREQLGLTLGEAAERAGLKTRQRWHNIESGVSDNPGIRTLESMAKVLRVKAKDLLK